jgi:glycosyltransferase involved in cell wall biosynthesis
MKILVSHPTANPFARALVEGLADRGLLASFCTTVARARRGVRVERELIREFPAREVARLIAGRMGWAWPVRHEHGWASIDAVYRDLDRRVARLVGKGCTAVYAYEDGALETFRAARQLGIRCCYELPIAYWETSRRLLEEEAERLPEWAPTLGGTRDSPEKLRRKTEEIALADRVICPSEFVRRSLPEGTKSALAEFGSPPSRPGAGEPRSRGGNEPLRVLFVGSMTQRKGLADLFAAMRLLGRGDVELTVMGSPMVAMTFYRQQFPGFIHRNPRTHGEVLELMGRHDVLVLPSLVEGRALVQQEALSRGLPIIVTPNAGGEDLVVEGETGFLVPIRSPEPIARRIAWFAENRDPLESMRAHAVERAASRTWQRYVDLIVEAVG